MRFYWPIAKLDAERRMVWGYASTEAEDDQGETVSREALAEALDDYMRFANIREMHQPSAVGVAKEAAIDDRGLYLGAKIVDADAWQKIVEGVYKGFSIGGRVTARDPADRGLITGLRLTEISVVDRPANPEAVFDCWKRSNASATEDTIESAAGDDPHGDIDYADPGYQPDSRKRYPIDSERHIRAAWAFIHMPHNARRYTASELERIKARIIAAWQAAIDPEGPPAAPSPPSGAVDAARKNVDQLGRLVRMIDDLGWLSCLLQSLVAAQSGEPADGDDDQVPATLAALAASGRLGKIGQPDVAPHAGGLAKLAEDIMPRLDALQRRVEDIARTPLPAQTVARGFAGISKREDGGGAAPSGDDIVAALARMSDEERTLTLIKAAHANPITGDARRR